MKLQLTNQDVLDANSLKPVQGLFGTLTVSLGKTKKKPLEKRIQFATTLKAVKGLEVIIQNMVVEALALNKAQEEEAEKKKQAVDESMQKLENATVIMPNRAMKRAIKKKQPKA